MRTVTTPQAPAKVDDSSSEDMNVARELYQDHFKPTGYNEEQMNLTQNTNKEY